MKGDEFTGVHPEQFPFESKWWGYESSTYVAFAEEGDYEVSVQVPAETDATISVRGDQAGCVEFAGYGPHKVSIGRDVPEGVVHIQVIAGPKFNVRIKRMSS